MVLSFRSSVCTGSCQAALINAVFRLSWLSSQIILDQYTTAPSDLIITEDFNLHYDRPNNTDVSCLWTLLPDNRLQQVIKKATHQHGNTLGWLVVSEDRTLQQAGVLDLTLAYHRAVSCELSFNHPKQTLSHIKESKKNQPSELPVWCELLHSSYCERTPPFICYQRLQQWPRQGSGPACPSSLVTSLTAPPLHGCWQSWRRPNERSSRQSVAGSQCVSQCTGMSTSSSPRSKPSTLLPSTSTLTHRSVTAPPANSFMLSLSSSWAELEWPSLPLTFLLQTYLKPFPSFSHTRSRPYSVI